MQPGAGTASGPAAKPHSVPGLPAAAHTQTGTAAAVVSYRANSCSEDTKLGKGVCHKPLCSSQYSYNEEIGGLYKSL